MATLEDLRAAALAMPEAVEAPHFHLTSFRIGKRIFAQETQPKGMPDATYAIVNVPEARREMLAEVDPDAFTIATWGAWRGLRVRLDRVDAETLADLVSDAWEAIAPKRLHPHAKPKR